MVDDHLHGDDGHVVITTDDSAAEVDDSPPAEVEEVVAAEVRIAEINAKRDVELARLQVRAGENYDTSELDRLRGEVTALREIVERLAPPVDPDPEPAPVIVETADVAPEPEIEAPPPAEHKPPKRSSGGGGWFP